MNNETRAAIINSRLSVTNTIKEHMLVIRKQIRNGYVTGNDEDVYAELEVMEGISHALTWEPDPREVKARDIEGLEDISNEVCFFIWDALGLISSKDKMNKKKGMT